MSNSLLPQDSEVPQIKLQKERDLKMKHIPTWRSPIVMGSGQIPKVGDVIGLSSRRDRQGKEEGGREGRMRSKGAHECRDAREFPPVSLSTFVCLRSEMRVGSKWARSEETAAERVPEARCLEIQVGRATLGPQ